MTTTTNQLIDEQLLADSQESSQVERNLYYLCDRVGARFACTPGYRRAAEYMRDRFVGYGLERVHLEPFEILAWRRGEPSELRMTAPFAEHIDCYALPYSASTDPAGASAEVVDLGDGSAERFEQVGDALAGRLALIGKPSRHRRLVYADLVDAGAAGMLFVSRAEGMGLVTGSVGDGEPGAIPAVSIGCEAGLKLQRLMRDQPVRCHLVSQHVCETDTTWNVVGELTGSDHPDELIVVGGHLDSHEIGPGAYDNCAGAVTVMEIARLLAGRRERLKRTIRFIGFAAEEVGLLGSHHHARANAESLQRARVMFNCDTPAYSPPFGMNFYELPDGEAFAKRLAGEWSTHIPCGRIGHQASDHYPFSLQGVPAMALSPSPDGPRRNHFGHMAGDTPEKLPMGGLNAGALFSAQVLVRIANDEQWPGGNR